MLLGGDEFGNSQAGNNNAYAQDNETGWVDWTGLAADAAFTGQVGELIALRRRLPMLRWPAYVHDAQRIRWLRPDGDPNAPEDWEQARAKMLLLREGEAAVCLLINASPDGLEFHPPDPGNAQRWHCAFTTSPPAPLRCGGPLKVPNRCIVLLEAIRAW
jgi:glycogen operon protein